VDSLVYYCDEMLKKLWGRSDMQLANSSDDSGRTSDKDSPRSVFKRDKIDELYSVEKLVGEGNYAEVYRAKNRLTKEKVAIKRLMRKPSDVEQGLSIDREEQYLVKNIDHPNVVRLHQLFKTSRMVCIVQDLADGGDIAKYMKKEQKFTESDAKAILVQVLRGLQHLHEHGVVHRDIKPGNILFTTQGEIKIADFGLSAIVKEGESTVTGQYGTPYYAAPEVFRNEAYTGLADMWSLGVMMFFMLSGTQAFEAENSRAVKARVLQGAFDMRGPLWSGISAECKDLIRCLIQMDTNKRLAASQALTHPWFSAVPSPTQTKDPTGLITSPRAVMDF